MSAGELREKLVFEKRAEEADAYGNTQGDWEEQFTVRARIRPRFGGETVLSERLANRQPYTITIRSSMQARAVTADWRVRNARTDEVFNIRSVVNPDEKNAYIELLCEGGVAT